MARRRSRRVGEAQARKQGQPAGVAIYAGPPREGSIQIDLLRYGRDRAEQRLGCTVEQALAAVGPGHITWIDVDGVHDAALVQQLCEGLKVHPLAMEDVLNPATRAKVDDYGDHLLVILKMMELHTDNLDLDQTSLLIGRSWVLSFQERRGDLWNGVRRRLLEGGGKLRQQEPALLLHALLDAVVDGYFAVLDRLEDEVDAVEERTFDREHVDLPRVAHDLRLRLSNLRRLIWPAREALSSLQRGESSLVSAGALPFYRDLIDHLSQCIDLMDTCRDRLTAVVELHLAMEGHRLNQIMRVLTVVATIFMPLTFVAGVYGMNFEYMPELSWRYGYPAALGFMLMVGLGMAIWFQRRRWL